ncbi:MAG: hypothetical protein J6R23_06545 [Spirochaetales bacterium]|nr:hypothetical protein [Spirochaetales bacterium]
MIASLIFIGCEAAPENVLQNDLPAVDEPTVPEDPKDKFVGKWIYEEEGSSFILEVSPYGSGLAYYYEDGVLADAPIGFTYVADGNNLSVHGIYLGDVSLDPVEAEYNFKDAVYTFDEESGSLVAEDETVLLSMYKENPELALDGNVFGKWMYPTEGSGYSSIEMTPAGYMIYNIGGKSHLAKYSTAEGKLRYNDVEASYSVAEGKLNFSLNGEDVIELTKVVALDENEIVGSYINPELALNITDNGLFVSIETPNDCFDVEIITEITESEIVACYWYDPDEEFVVTAYSYDASGINIDGDGDLLKCEKSDTDILVPTLVTGGVGYLDKNETTYMFPVKSIFDEHVKTHDGECGVCEGSFAKYVSPMFGLDESILKPLDDADNILMYSEFVGDSLVSMLGAYEIDGENIHISFCTEEGVMEKTITLVYVPVSDMFYVVDGDVKTLFVTSGA